MSWPQHASNTHRLVCEAMGEGQRMAVGSWLEDRNVGAVFADAVRCITAEAVNLVIACQCRIRRAVGNGGSVDRK